MIDVKDKAMQWLTRREHSVAELRYKLEKANLAIEDTEQALSDLIESGLLCDRRYAQMLARTRSEKGQGPIRIRHELQQKQVAPDLIEEALMEQDIDWLQLASRVRQKKFGEIRPSNYQDQVKQKAFLQYRGFTAEQIDACLALLDD